MRSRRALMVGLPFLAVALVATRPARAGNLDAAGHFVFAGDDLLAMGFESFADAQAVGASSLTWNTTNDNDVYLQATGVTADDWSALVVTGTTVLEGNHALKVSAGGTTVGLAFVNDATDRALFESLETQRLQITFWGYSVGAEPELEVVYPSPDEPVGPDGFGRVVAIRTGRETSDGWAEYSTGPIEGMLWNDPIGTLNLSARVATPYGVAALDSYDLAPGPDAEAILDPSAFAYIDALEIAPVSGAVTPYVACTQANVATTCGDQGDCTLGVCTPGAVTWGPIPAIASDRQDFVGRWAFLMSNLHGDRSAAANASTLFTSTAVSNVAAATEPPAFYGGLNTLVNGLRDAHTSLGGAPSEPTQFYEGIYSFGASSSGLDACFGLAKNDLPGGSGSFVYSVFWVAPDSIVGPGGSGSVEVDAGDLLTAIDGQDPDAWLTAVGPLYRTEIANDPSAEPSGRALVLSAMLEKYAATATFATCTADGTCSSKTVAVGTLMNGLYTGSYPNATTYSRTCTGRFTDAVSTWSAADDYAYSDVALTETSGNITAVEFDGFDAAYDDNEPSTPFHAWADPVDAALTSGTNLLFDARYGHGGYFSLGHLVDHAIRPTSSPYFALFLPRGTWETPDPTWLFGTNVGACVNAPFDGPTLCSWTGDDIDEATESSAPASGVKVAWIDGNDVSMNDITPRNLQGAANVRIFGPHPTSGAYGEVTQVPPLIASWQPGTMQILDARFGATFADAVAAPWGSGTGVAPDQVVVQLVSDQLSGTDTILTAAKAWLNQ